MSEPLFKLQITDRTGTVVQLPGGGSLEADFIQICTNAVLEVGGLQVEAACVAALTQGIDQVLEQCVASIAARGIGIWRNETHVKQAIRDGLRETLKPDIKVRVVLHPAPGSVALRGVIADGLKAAVQAVKDRTREVV